MGSYIGECLYGIDPIEAFETHTKKIWIHTVDNCDGPCPFHQPSKHHMRNWPIDTKGRMTMRICPHGIVHPDPDAMVYFKTCRTADDPLHMCDGCCCAPDIPSLAAISVQLDLLLETTNAHDD